MIRIWSSENGECLHTLTGHTNSVLSVSCSPLENSFVSASADRTIKSWSADDGSCLGTLTGHTEVVTSVSFSSLNGLIVSGSLDQTVRVWSARDGAELCRYHTESLVRCVATHVDESGKLRIVAGLHNGQIVWLVLEFHCATLKRIGRR